MAHKPHSQAIFRRTVEGKRRDDIRTDAVNTRVAAQIALAKRSSSMLGRGGLLAGDAENATALAMGGGRLSEPSGELCPQCNHGTAEWPIIRPCLTCGDTGHVGTSGGHPGHVAEGARLHAEPAPFSAQRADVRGVPEPFPFNHDNKAPASLETTGGVTAHGREAHEQRD